MHFKAKKYFFFDPASPQIIHLIAMKIDMVDYVLGIKKFAKFYHANFSYNLLGSIRPDQVIYANVRCCPYFIFIGPTLSEVHAHPERKDLIIFLLE